MKHLLFASILMTSISAFAGNEKGNGGDTVVCDGKLRTLDSVVMEGERFFTIAKKDSYKKSLSDISTKLSASLPKKARELKSFLKTYEEKGNVEEGIFWINSTLKDVADENLYINLPDNCSKELKQTVVLVKKPFKRYYYDSKIINTLAAEKDELSWLLIHEWLRDSTDDSDVIRIINAYLHSEEFQNDSDEEIHDTLTRFGMYELGEKMSDMKASEAAVLKVLPKLRLELDAFETKLNLFKNEASKKEKEKLRKEMIALQKQLQDQSWDFTIAFKTDLTEINPELEQETRSVYNRYHYLSRVVDFSK